jgi:hypothetical protein
VILSRTLHLRWEQYKIPLTKRLIERYWISVIFTESSLRSAMLIVAQLVKKFSTFYVAWRFITGFTRAHHWSVSWARQIQSIPSHPVANILFNIILPSTSMSSEWSLHYILFNQNFVCISQHCFNFKTQVIQLLLMSKLRDEILFDNFKELHKV